MILTLQSISPKFYEQILQQHSFAKKIQSQNEIREKLHQALLYEKGSSKMLIKLIPDVGLSSFGASVTISVYWTCNGLMQRLPRSLKPILINRD